LAPHGGLRDHVFAFRTLEDCRNIVAHARHAKRVVVLGGGVAALEAVRGLHGLCPDVHLVHRGNGLMRSQLGAAGAEALRARVEGLGVTVHLSKIATRVLEPTSLRRVVFNDGSSLECDLLVVAMGIQPATWLAYQAGLSVTRAIVVDSQLRSVDDPAVYALGECAEHRGQVQALAEQIREQARVLAAHITGSDPHLLFSPSRSVSSVPLFGIEAAWIGTTDAELPSDQVTQVTESELGGFYRLVLREGRLIGAIGLGKARRLEELSRTVTRVAS
jgi:nitrite reductase (NADH) large subunit